MDDNSTCIPEKYTEAQIPSAGSSGLAFNETELRCFGEQVIEEVTSYLSKLHDQPVWQAIPGDVREALRTQVIPEQGYPFPDTLAFFQQKILPYAQGNGHPRFAGWINSAPSHASVLLKPLATAMNPNCGIGEHAGQELERRVVQWMMELCGFPIEGSAGVFVSGGSEANFTCLQAARYWAAQQDGWDIRIEGLQGSHPPFILYQSDQGHFSVRKSVEAMGLGNSSIHIVRSTSSFQMDIEHLEQCIQDDYAAGLRPFCVAATAGTVETGAIDQLDKLADLCEKYHLWLHVDGAYGSFGILDPSIAPLYKGIERVNSLATDQHKWLSVPIDCGCALVRNGSILHDAFRLTHENHHEPDIPWMSEYTLQRTRRFRALDVWATVRTAGRAGLTSAIRRNIQMAHLMAQLIQEAPDLELISASPLSIVRFRYVPKALQDAPLLLDQLNKALVSTVQQRGKAFFTSTYFQQKETIRACLVNYMTDEADIVSMIEEVLAVGQQLSTTFSA